VVGALRKWAKDEDEPNLRWTAAAAFGTYWIGRRFPDDALRALRKMLESDSRLAHHISESIDVLFGTGRDEPEIAAKVLCALADWSADDRRTPELTVMGLGIFLNLAYGNVLPKDDEEAAGWPAVLFHGERDPEVRATIVTLWRRALADAAAQEAALEVLQRWMTVADEVTGVEAPVEGLLRDLAVTHREWRRLCVHLRRWASKTAEHPSRAASRQLARLMAAEPLQ